MTRSRDFDQIPRDLRNDRAVVAIKGGLPCRSDQPGERFGSSIIPCAAARPARLTDHRHQRRHCAPLRGSQVAPVHPVRPRPDQHLSVPIIGVAQIRSCVATPVHRVARPPCQLDNVRRLCWAPAMTLARFARFAAR
jgi:hypothetical protein